MEESEAIARLQGGDISGLEPLVRAYQVRAVRAAFLICHDRALAEDLVQAAFVRAYERIGQFNAARPFGPWFLQSVVHDAMKAAARQWRTVPLESDGDEAALLPDPGPAPEDLLEAAETSAAIRAALARLSPEQRAAIVLRYYLGLTESQMAAWLCIPPGTIKWRLHAARRRLRTLLPAWVQPGLDRDR